MIAIPQFNKKEALFDWLVENKSMLINQKKSITKEADGISLIMDEIATKEIADKAEQVIAGDVDKIFVRSIINTTKLLDSHGDVHIDGLWKKSLSESRENYLIQEHDFSFKGVISDQVEAYTKKMSWKSLGFDYEGSTEALIYDSIISKDRNPYMFEMYAKKKVKNHSVGMRYIKLFLAINSKMYSEEYETWQKYIDQVANRATAEEQGFFWAVTEAKDVEGSAVLKGSNFATPTQRVEEYTQAEKSLEQTEPPQGTQMSQLTYFNHNLI